MMRGAVHTLQRPVGETATSYTGVSECVNYFVGWQGLFTMVRRGSDIATFAAEISRWAVLRVAFIPLRLRLDWP